MWTAENRGRYDRSKLRYPSDLTEEEWALVRREIPPAKRDGNRRTIDVREVVNGLMYILSTGCQWRAMPKDLPPRSTVNRIPRGRTALAGFGRTLTIRATVWSEFRSGADLADGDHHGG